ncbi:MAG: Hint domain-containing protein [Cyanobacteria bacterium J06555_3]
MSRLIKSIAASLYISIVFSVLVVAPVFANNIAAGFGAGTMISTPDGDVAVENLAKGDRVIGYNFETHHQQENIVKEINQYSSLSYYSINSKTKIASPNLICVKTIITTKLVRLNKIEPGNILFSQNIIQ